MAIWVVLQPASERKSSASVDDVRPGYLFQTAPLLLIGIAVFVAVLRGSQGLQRAFAAGVKALGEGDFARAARDFEGLARRYRWIRPLAAVAEYNLGIALVYEGRLANALGHFKVAEGRGARALRPHVAIQFALVNALRGALDPARQWRAEAETRLKAIPDTGVLGGILAFATCVIDLREGRHDEILGWTDERWRKLEGNLTARTTRPLRVLRAFAMARSARAGEDGAVRKTIDALEPLRAGEFALLEAEWREMREFLAAVLRGT